MASVAQRLGTTAMSLYRYVASRHELEVVMVDLALGPAPSLNPRRSWRRELEDWARADARHLAAHPWVLDVRPGSPQVRSEEHTSELQSLRHLVCRLLLEKKKKNKNTE